MLGVCDDKSRESRVVRMEVRETERERVNTFVFNGSRGSSF